MILTIGETLIDSFPSYSNIGGAPLNFSIHSAHFGEDVILVTRVGNDEKGKMITDFMEKHSLDTRYVQKDNIHKTGEVIVSMENNKHSFNILEDTAYDYIGYPDIPDEIMSGVKCFYFGTLIQRTVNGYDVVRKIIDRLPSEAMIFCDINLRPGCYTDAVINESLEKCSVLKVNDEELEYLKQLNCITCTDQSAVIRLKEKYDIKAAAVTRGEEGAEFFYAGKYIKGKEDKKTEIKDTVGAGDAFSAVMVKGLLDNREPEEIIENALEFAASVCGIKGAVPDSEDTGFYEKYSR